MPALDVPSLLDDLIDRARNSRDAVHRFRTGESAERLLARPAPDAWSAAECIDHLNVTNRHYVDALEATLADTAPSASPPRTYRPGWILGDRMVQGVDPDALDQKRSAPSFMQPTDPADLDVDAVCATYLDHADRLLDVLDTARNHDLGGVRVPSSIAFWIRLKLGDVLRLLVLHDQRHLIQARRALDAAPAGDTAAPDAAPTPEPARRRSVR